MTGVCRLALLLLFPLWLSAAASPSYTIETIPNVRLADRNNYVSNPDGIIRSDDAARINSLLRTVEDSLGIEIAVVAVKSIGDNDARMFATDLFQYWKPGKKGKDNGLLIQLVTDPPQRSVVFETGYGLEGVLPDAICYRMQQRYMLPDFKAGDYSAGMQKGVEAVKNYLMASDYERASIVGDEQEMDDEEFFEIIGIFLIIFILSALIACLIRSSYMHRPRVCPRCGQKNARLCRPASPAACNLRQRRTGRRTLALQELRLHRKEKPYHRPSPTQRHPHHLRQHHPRKQLGRQWRQLGRRRFRRRRFNQPLVINMEKDSRQD